jgi:hypothetical protein
MQIQVKVVSLACILLIPAILLSASCTNRGKPVKNVSETEAIKLANAEMVRNGLKVEDYKMAIETSSSGEDWLVFFDPKIQRKPGGGYYVAVNKVNGEVIFKVGD